MLQSYRYFLRKSSQFNQFFSTSPQFQEATFIKEFLDYGSEKNYGQMQTQLKENVHSINRLNTVIAFLDKSYKRNFNIDQTLQQKLLERVQTILNLKESVEFNSKLVKGLLITLALNQVQSDSTYTTILSFIQNNYKEIPEIHIITILETITYNKILNKFEKQIDESSLGSLLKVLSSYLIKGDINDQDFRASLLKIGQLIIFMDKNQFKYYTKNIKTIVLSLITRLEANFFSFSHQIKSSVEENQSDQLMLKQNTSSQIVSSSQLSEILQLIQLADILEQVMAQINLTQKRQIQEDFKRHQEIIKSVTTIISQNLNDKCLSIIEISENHLQAIFEYLKKYPNSPPVFLPKEVHQLIGNTYQSLIQDCIQFKEKSYLKNINQYAMLVSFLSKTTKSLNLSDTDFEVIVQLIPSEKNIFVLSRIMESIANISGRQHSHHSHTLPNSDEKGHQHNPKQKSDKVESNKPFKKPDPQKDHKHEHHHHEHDHNHKHDHGELKIQRTESQKQVKSKRDIAINCLELRIIELSKGLLNPTAPLLLLFQSLIELHPYKPTTSSLHYLVEYFSYGKIVEKMKWIELIVKLIPSLGVLTKSVSLDVIQLQTQEQIQESQKTIQLVTKLWAKVIQLLILKIDNVYLDKIPTILVHISQTNMLNIPGIPQLLVNLRIIVNISLKFFQIMKNLSKFKGKSLIEISYSFARLEFKDRQFYRDITYYLIQNFKTLVDITFIILQNLTTFDRMNLLWCLSIIKLKSNKLIENIHMETEEVLKSLTGEGLVQYLQSAATLRFKPDQKILSMILEKIVKLEFQESQNFIGISNILQYEIAPDQNINLWNTLLKLIKENPKLLESPFNAHTLQIILFHQKNVSKHEINKDIIEQFEIELARSLVALVKYYKQYKQIKQSRLELKITSELKILEKDEELKTKCFQASKTIYTIENILENPQRLKLESNEIFIPYTVDYRIGSYCFEVNGPIHYLSNFDEEKEILDGPTQLKKQMVESIGLKYIEISYKDVQELEKEVLRDYLKQLILKS